MNERKPRILMLLDNHYGPDRRVEQEVSLLENEGMNVRLVAWDRRSDSSSETVHMSPQFELRRVAVTAPPRGGIKSLSRLVLWYVAVLIRSVRIMKDVDVLVVHDVYLLPLGYLLAKIFQTPLIYDAHEDFRALESGRYPEKVIDAVVRIESVIAKRAAGVVVPGNNRVSRWAQDNIAPIVLTNAGAIDDVNDGLRSNGEPQFAVVYCGSLDPNRRVDLLLDWAEENPDEKVAIAGSGRLENELSARARTLSNVVMDGWTSDPVSFLRKGEVIYYGLDADSPYSDKACPNTLYLAISIGRPIVFFCGGELAEFADRFSIGCRVPASLAGLSEAINTCRKANSWEFGKARDVVKRQSSGREFVALIKSLVERER